MLGPYELNQIYTGDARELSKAIPDESVDLIFCDPVYERIEDYAWLAQIAMRILKPNRACLAWTSTKKSRSCQIVMEDAGLSYQWLLNYVVPAKTGALHHYGVFLWTTQCLYFAKGHFKASPYIPDTFISQTPPNTKFEWNKNPAVIERWIESFSERDSVIFDPFTGMGTVPAVCQKLGRSYLAFEINPVRAQEARERVLSSPLCLPFTAPMTQEQLLETKPER